VTGVQTCALPIYTPELAQDRRVGDRAALLGVMEQYYNGYRFASRATERIYNSTLVLYFLLQLKESGRYPEEMMDLNVRTDYARLYRIARLAGGGDEENRILLETILKEGQIDSALVEQFGSVTAQQREQLVSLFYYMGMLTLGEQPADALVPRLIVPNRVIRTLQWEYLAVVLRETEQLSLDTMRLAKAIESMAVRGDIEPLLKMFREQVLGMIGVKDQRQFNEGTLKLMLAAYLSQARVFTILSEKEFARGYCDLFLALNDEVPAGKYAWMLEVKYLKTNAKAGAIEKFIEKAYGQLERYTSDEAFLKVLTRGRGWKAGVLVFVGAKEVIWRPWPKT